MDTTHRLPAIFAKYSSNRSFQKSDYFVSCWGRDVTFPAWPLAGRTKSEGRSPGIPEPAPLTRRAVAGRGVDLCPGGYALRESGGESAHRGGLRRQRGADDHRGLADCTGVLAAATAAAGTHLPPSPLLTFIFALALASACSIVVAPVKVAKCMQKRNISLASRRIILCVRGRAGMLSSHNLLTSASSTFGIVGGRLAPLQWPESLPPLAADAGHRAPDRQTLRRDRQGGGVRQVRGPHPPGAPLPLLR